MPSTTTSEFTRRIDAGRQAVLAQTGFLHAQFGRSASHWKHDGSRVTEADMAISEGIFAELRRQFPGDDFFSEELAPSGSPLPRRGEWSWVLDPIDGTNNFALGIPVAAISLGLLHQGEPAYGFVYDLGRRSLFHGGPGQGLWVDDTPLAVTFASTESAEQFVAMHSPISARYQPLVQAVLGRFKLRAFGAGTLHLTYAALGIIDASMDFTVKVWDVAAAAAFCRESGAPMHFLCPSPFPLEQFDVTMKPLPYVAGRPEVVAEIMALIAQSGWRKAAGRDQAIER